MQSTALRVLIAAVVSLCAAATLTRAQPGRSNLTRAQSGRSNMDDIAEQYVRLVLALGQHDADYVDAFYGPAAWKAEAEARRVPLDAIAADARTLIARLRARPPAVPSGGPRDLAAGDDLESLRQAYLGAQLAALETRVRMMSGTRLTFDEESNALYDAVAPVYPESHFQAILRELEPLVPGSGPLIERYDRFRQEFVIPADRLARVFARAIDECRSRTLKHIQLPSSEGFEVEYVTGKSWSGYNWYQGGFHSLIQVNTDLPIYVDRAVDLACHEGYPGHHVYNVLLEQRLVRDRRWIEFTVYALFSPQSLIAEGSANYGIEVAFPGEERTVFEREVLFPLAGLPPARAATYARVQALVERLGEAGNEAARAYLDGGIDRAQAAKWLTDYAMMSPPRAEQRTRFIDQYRSYVINYNLGKQLVKAHVEAGSGGRPDRQWPEFERLLAAPRRPSALLR